MNIRAMTAGDLERLIDLDPTREATAYLHVERAGQGLGVSWRLEERPLREKRVEANALDEETAFALRQVVGGIEEGTALVAEHEEAIAGLLLARVDAAPARGGVLDVLDVRVDYDQRRQGLGTVLLFRAIAEARERGLRAVSARTLADNVPAARFLSKAGFDLAGLDTHALSNHDLVKERVTFMWYAALD